MSKKSNAVEKFLPLSKNLRNIECPIAYEPIKYGDYFKTCAECKWNFSLKTLSDYFKSQQKFSPFSKCPMCREEWKNDTIFVNKSSRLEEKFQMKKKIQTILKLYK
jgi:hypothetical protein